MSLNIDLKELRVRESERVEWKEHGDEPEIAKSIAKTISAFANDIANLGGGYVVCGAMEDKDEYGFPKVIFKGLSATQLKQIEGKVTQYCREYISPAIAPLVTELPNPEDEATRILIFTVIASPEIHAYRDKTGQAYYVRISRETREARNGMLMQLLTKKNKLDYFDRRVNVAASIGDIELLAVKDYVQEMGEDFSETPIDEYLSDTRQIAAYIPPLFAKTGLDQVLRPRNFALLIFGKKESLARLFTEAYTVVSIYGGTDRSAPTAERHIIGGNIVWQARRTIELLQAQSYTAFDKTNDRPNQEKYPLRALQEAAVNAIVHRDYEIPAPNRITVFSDRIEINSIGALHWSVDKAQFLQGRANPFWRNQSLAYIFNKLHLAQAEGQGLPTIFKSMEREGNPRPIFEIGEQNILCTIPAHIRHQQAKITIS